MQCLEGSLAACFHSDGQFENYSNTPFGKSSALSPQLSILPCSEVRWTYLMCGSLSKPTCITASFPWSLPTLHVSLILMLNFHLTPTVPPDLASTYILCLAGHFHTALATIQVHFAPLALAQHAALDPSDKSKPPASFVSSFSSSTPVPGGGVSLDLHICLGAQTLCETVQHWWQASCSKRTEG